MRPQNPRLVAFLFGILPFAVSLSARADDTEIFNTTPINTGAPNILFVIDTSGSMGSTVIKPDPYDPSKNYTGTCTNDSIYYSSTGTPTCKSPTFTKSELKCVAATTALFNSADKSGLYAGNANRWLVTETQTSSTSTTATTTQKYKITYSTTQPATQLWTVNSKGKWSTSGSVVLGTPITKGAETSVPSGSVTKSNTAPTSPATTDTFTYAWTTAFAAPKNTTATGSGASVTTPSSTTTPGTASSTGTSTTAIDPAPTGSLASPYTQKLTYTTNYTRTDSTFVNTGNTTTTTTTNILYTVSDVECDGDKTSGSGTLGFPNNYNVTSSSAQWTPTKANSYWDTNGAIVKYTFYTGNYINYKANPPGTNEGTRLSVVQKAATDLIDKISNVNVGLMRYSDNGSDFDCTSGNQDPCAKGGMVTYAMSPIDSTTTGMANKTAIKSVINSYNPGGYTPLSETLFEAYRYYSGGDILFGLNSKVGGSIKPSIKESRVGGTLLSTKYQSPITASCQTSYIVYLTDGLPTQDNQADSLISALPNFNTLGGGCDDTTKAPYGSSWGPGNNAGACLAGLAQYMYNADLSGQSGSQKVASYFIGFGSDFVTNGQLNSAFSYLEAASKRGGGIAYQAGDSAELATTLEEIVTDISKRSVSFVAPSVAVDAFNRSQTLNDLFFSVFQPSATAHWPGNIKKYRFGNGTIQDATGVSAIDPVTGFFSHSAQSIWSTQADGEDVQSGGAANRLPDPAPRNIYTYIGSNPGTPVDLTSSGSYAVNTGNTLLTNTTLNIGGTGDPAAATLINWARGLDVQDENNDGNKNDTRHVMGDPIHSRPSVVVYGGTEGDPDLVLFAATNDGYLHAIGGKDGDGQELWSFIPQEFLGDLVTLYKNNPANPRHYSLDGDVVVIKFDTNGDGIIQPADGDRVIVYFGEGRGGNRYHALDVTDRNHPQYMWTLGAAQLPGIGQTWSTPTFMKINIQGATQNAKKVAMFIGGGYDPAEDSAGYSATDSVGNHLYIVDALSGALLWSNADLSLSQFGHAMDHAIPSAISVIDLDADGFADRMYVGDMAGQIWRFDITNGNPKSSLVAGGVIASLGTHDETTHTTANQRRFYYPPSVALVQPPRAPAFFNIGLGSGYRGHPLEKTAHDRFYSIRDYNPNASLTQAQFNTYAVVTDAALTDVTDMKTKPSKTAPGWKILLDVFGSGWNGEKILSQARTLQNIIYFQSYIPSTSSGAGSCVATTVGTNLSYQVNLLDGMPLIDGTVPYTQLQQGGIAPEVVFLFGKNASESSILINTETQKCKAGCGRDATKTYWRSLDSE